MKRKNRIISIILSFALICAALCDTAGAEYLFLPESIDTEAAILIDGRTGAYLFEKNADRAMYPASTTKIMTCILALEYGHLNDIITIPSEAGDVPKDSSKIPVTVGEQMPFIDLIYGFMIMSGNDGANAIAVIVGGSVDNFVRMMNDKAASLGMTGTHFSNAHGYHADDHYTTARDMSVLTYYCMQNEMFREIVSTPAYIIGPTNKREGNLKLVSTNLMLVNGSEFYYDGCLGVKTGFTRAAGQTFVCAAERDGAQLIAVLMKSGSASEDAQRWQDTKKLLDYGFTRYRFYNMQSIYSMDPARVTINGAANDDPYGGELELMLINMTGDYTAACLDGDTSEALSHYRSYREISLSADLTAPIEEGTIIGTLSYVTPDNTRVTGTLVANRSVEEQPQVTTASDFLPFLKDMDTERASQIVKIGVLLIAAILIVNAIRSSAAKRRRKAARRRRKGGTYYKSGLNRSRYY